MIPCFRGEFGGIESEGGGSVDKRIDKDTPAIVFLLP